MSNNYMLDKQIIDAKANFNYFYVKMINKILKLTIVLAMTLLITEIINSLIFTILGLIIVGCTIFSILNVVSNYRYILNDIRKTCKKESFIFVIDIDEVKNNLIGAVVGYGK